MTSLGFFTYDRNCQEDDAIFTLETETLPQEEDAEEEDVDDDDSGFVALIAICASSLFLLGLLGVFVYWFCIRKSRNKQSIVPDDSQEPADTGVEPSSKTGI